ncbi:hypothetical protein ACFSTD_11305 [Novosphingobium colocasiae]
MLLHPAYAGCDVTYVTTFKGMADRDGIDAALLLPDANRDNPGDAWRCLVASVKLIRRHRPEVLITTGALPGLFCLIVARLLGGRARSGSIPSPITRCPRSAAGSRCRSRRCG